MIIKNLDFVNKILDLKISRRDLRSSVANF